MSTTATMIGYANDGREDAEEKVLCAASVRPFCANRRRPFVPAQDRHSAR